MNDLQKHDRHFIISFMILPCVLLCLTLLFPFLLNGRDNTAKNMVMLLQNAAKNGNKIPVLSIDFPELDLTGAYTVQKSFILLQLHSPQNEKIAGFKAGLTSTGAMKRFGLEQPVAGILLTSGKLSSQTAIHPPHASAVMMMECEIGYIADRVIDQPIKDVHTLKAYFKHTAPVIELPNLGYTDMKRLTGPDIVASNVGAAGFVIGDVRRLEQVEPDQVSVLLIYNGNTVNKGKGPDAMGGQWHALLWLVNHTVKQGWSIQPGHLLITGAMGKMLPAKPGKYSADYGNFGKIEFTVQ